MSDKATTQEPLVSAASQADDRLVADHWMPPQAGIVARVGIGRRWISVLRARPVAGWPNESRPWNSCQSLPAWALGKVASTKTMNSTNELWPRTAAGAPAGRRTTDRRNSGGPS